MDTPLPAQIRPAQPEATQASEADEMELMEMILGALGRDALGMGSSIAHPRESEEWKGMNQQQKLEFFAPIWRIMRDDNMTVQQVEALSATADCSTIDLAYNRYIDRDGL